MREKGKMKKSIMILFMTLGLAGCVQQPSAPKEDMRLRAAYSACINTAEGSSEKLEACRSVLDVLKSEKAHQQFAHEESVRTLDYQQCLDATHTGNGQAVKANCDRIWQEIRSNNTP
ncbi:putative lipoprotein ChiQ [Phytobacter sp. AG2a]|jgi:Zn-dependent M32 family carboxypeptidase